MAACWGAERFNSLGSVYPWGMTTPSFAPPCVAPVDAIATLKRQGYAVLNANSVAALAHCDLTELHALEVGWSDLHRTTTSRKMEDVTAAAATRPA